MADPYDRLAADADRLAAERRRVPAATYRLQMHAGFSLADAARITPYLHSLGITHVYTSSVLAARPGSTHGYDVVDHSRLNSEIGTEPELFAWIGGLRERGMGWILDAVPNHMSVWGPNEWWADVLEHGQASPVAGHFDIAWNDHPRDRLHGKVLLPILGQPFGAEIEAGRFRVELSGGSLFVAYNDLRLPVDPRTYALVLSPALDAARAAIESDDPDLQELQSILNAVRHLPARTETDPVRLTESWTESRVIKRRLAELTGRNEAIARHIRDAALQLSGVPGDPSSFARLEEFLEAQAYRPSYWRVASDEINYRRFFDINDLAALSTERYEVFVDVHKKVFEWIGDGWLDGLRIDHPDGLFDPKQYLDRLQLFTRLGCARHLLTTRPGDYPDLSWPEAEGPLRERFEARPARPLYVVVEKILGESEPLPPDWAMDGTTGYQFINVVNGLFVDPRSESELTRVYHDLSGFHERFDDLVYHCKFHLLQSTLASELHMLAHQLDRLAQDARWSRDFTLNGLRHALREVIACFPVYRSYVNGGVSDQDRKVILRSIARAKHRNPLLGRPVFDFIRDTLLLKDPPSGPATPDYRAAQRRFAGKFQQVTAPAMAKGFEDTALYIDARLLSLNEVGGDPTRFGRLPNEVHHYLRERGRSYPGGMSPLSTHDTKRSEDVRARINVLSEIPGDWAKHVNRWMEVNRRHKTDMGDGQFAPDANEEYFLYQTLIGAWPVGGLTPANRTEFTDRIQAYMNKVLREAKIHSSWINPSPEYDTAVAEFVARLLDPEKGEPFLRDFEPFQRTVSRWGMINSLAQTLLRCTVPGVPDTFQGTELWDFSLVDPDNRRPVDFEHRQRLLADLDRGAASDPRALARELVDQMDDGRAKLFVVSRALRLRRDHAELIQLANYIPVDAIGPGAGHVFCFVQVHGSSAALVLVPRLVARRLPGVARWDETGVLLPDELADFRWSNVLTGESIGPAMNQAISVTDILGPFPVALLIGGS